MRAIRFIMICLMVAIFGCGCGGGPQFNYVGRWEARRELTGSHEGVNPDAVYQASRIVLDMRVDGTFTLVDAGVPRDGEFTVDGDHAVLTVEKRFGQPMSRQPADVQKLNVPLRLTANPKDGTVRYYDPAGYDSTGFVMKRISDTPNAPSKL